ncbi:right-handed parallel beta-helix repeat-containing protein [Pseudarthrobacter sp. HLT3-5]|uniref:right-handed parallel beta-helix repeat-containing protein n=1 Tax=Pseudarthrobacter cellobiosi TaxID=2953654 RepID=UPI00208F739C|nr:right-handed parallel beta-helix repeat-containing protein [Pseudarthrobacter sp. HLT3-5]MCO4276552.1 right-handed parallel beta-helix repeat-containing protein [Pseudarthrobacter sp. HLT3-5]
MMRNEGQPPREIPAVLRRRQLLNLGTLLTALTGASAISALGANGAAAAPGNTTLPNLYVPLTEKGTASGVATLDLESKIPLAQLPELSATYATLDSAGRQPVRKGELFLNVKDYGAAGDGVADDSPPLQAALNAALPDSTIFFPSGRYRLVSGLTSASPRVHLTGSGIIRADTPEMTMLTVTGPGTTASIHFDGGNKAAVGARVTAAGCQLVDGLLENFRSEAGGATAIRVETEGGVLIERNVIANVTAVGDKVTGNSVGASRAVLVTSRSAATGSNIVRHNRISSILGEEGDAIQILFGLSPFLTARAVISGNLIETVSRRAIKVQGSDCSVTDNTYTHLGPAPAGTAAALIDVIHSDRVLVSGNVLDSTYFTGIQASGQPQKSTGVQILDNVVRSGTAIVGIYVANMVHCKVQGNTVEGGSAGIWATGSSDVNILSNILKGIDGAGNGMRILSSCARIVVAGNIANGVARVWMIQNDSPGAHVHDNVNAPTSGTGGCVRATSTSKGSVYRGNASLNGGAAVYSEAYDDMVVSMNRGASGTGSGDVFWTTAVPSTEQPNMSHSRGDVAYNRTPKAGGTIGWICVTAGKPGVWKSLGNAAV